MCAIFAELRIKGYRTTSFGKWRSAKAGLLITTDKGFTQYRAAHHHGVPIVRLRKPNRLRIHKRIMQAMAQFPEQDWPGLLVVMRDVAQSTWRYQPKL